MSVAETFTNLNFRLAFNDDGTMGAFVVGSKEVVVFEIVERDGKIETRNIGKKIECLKEVLSNICTALTSLIYQKSCQQKAVMLQN